MIGGAAQHDTALHEPQSVEDPANEMLDSIERLVQAVLATAGDLGATAIETRLRRLLVEVEKGPQVTPEVVTAPAADEAAEVDPPTPAGVAHLDELELANLLVFLADMRRSAQSDGARIRLMNWRRRIADILRDVQEARS